MRSLELEQHLDTEQHYRAIEAAMLETPRGRWFLAEHSRRSRRLETTQLEEAIDRLKSSMRNPPALLGRLKAELDQITELIQVVRGELLARDRADSHHPVTSGSTTTGALLQIAEDLHEQIWQLQTREIDPDACERVGRQAVAILALTARQAQESQRTLRFADALDAISKRVAATLETVLHEGEPRPGEAASVYLPADAAE